MKGVERRLGIRRERQIVNRKHWNSFSLLVEAHSEMAVQDALDYMEFSKPGGESDRISKKHAGRRPNPGEAFFALFRR